MVDLRRQQRDYWFAIALTVALLAATVVYHPVIHEFLVEVSGTSHGVARLLAGGGAYVVEAALVAAVANMVRRVVGNHRAMRREAERLMAREALKRELFRPPPPRPGELPIVAAGPVWWDPRDPSLDAEGEHVRSPFVALPFPGGGLGGTPDGRARHDWTEAQWSAHHLDPTHMPDVDQRAWLDRRWHEQRRAARAQRDVGE